ncbi:hypothetical protein AAG570_008916 [Ranatra chinensis]|uniref:F-ATPase gamma subunit n=1 Tax=Ranatra chinensis TaxID=642074 RepID=A0ABD0ZFK7_9HEMI
MNIQKITSTMKMVSVSKFLKAEHYLSSARPLGEAALYFYNLAEIRADPRKHKNVVITCTSDRGLCGSMNAKVCRSANLILNSHKNLYDLICIGEKSKYFLGLEHGEKMILVVNGIGIGIPTFLDASLIASKLLEYKFTYGNIIYCRFNNLLSFKVSQLDLYGMPLLMSTPFFYQYDLDDRHDLLSFIEFTTAALIYYCLIETYITELAARIQTMTNSSKNAAELGKKLNVVYNRKRQAAVTLDLIDIVSGAAVVTK